MTSYLEVMKELRNGSSLLELSRNKTEPQS